MPERIQLMAPPEPQAWGWSEPEPEPVPGWEFVTVAELGTPEYRRVYIRPVVEHTEPVRPFARRPAENPMRAIEDMVSFSSKDWGEVREDAWLYAIVCGWDDDPDEPEDLRCDAMATVAQRHGWDEDTVARLRRLHVQWVRLANDGES